MGRGCPKKDTLLYSLRAYNGNLSAAPLVVPRGSFQYTFFPQGFGREDRQYYLHNDSDCERC